MRIDLSYGNESRSLIVPTGVTVDYVTPRESYPLEDAGQALAEACSNPVDAAPLRDLVDSATKVLLLVADLTRSGGTKEILPSILQHLADLGVPPSQIRVLIARGAHRRLSKEEKKYFREGPLKAIAVEEHDCDDAVKLSALLLTKHGTPVRVNRLLKESDLVIPVSPISFHYFAGFGGGRKLVLPGCADRAGIMANHRLSLQDTKPVKLHPACRPAKVDGNPVHEDMCEAMSAIKNLFAVNFFCDSSGALVYLNAGDAFESHREACEVYSKLHRVPVDGPHRILILSCGGFPYDMNLLQAHKALRHGAEIVAPGGAILFYAECSESVGSESLAHALRQKPADFLKSAYNQYDLNNQAGVSLVNLTSNYRIFAVTGLDDEVLENAGMSRCTNAEAFVAESLETYRSDRIAVIPFGSRTLPFVRGGELG